MDPIAAIGVLSKILGFGLSSWEAFKSSGFDEKDLLALRSFLDAAGGVLGVAISPKESEAAAQQLALITRAFGQAFGRHWAFNKDFVPLSRFRTFMSKEQKQRVIEIEARTRYAAEKLLKPGELPVSIRELTFISSLTGSPLNTPYYRALWDAFSNPQLANEETGEPPLLDVSENTRREFERNFLIVYWEGLASSAGRGISSYIEGLEKYRALLIRELLLKDLSTWRERHLFGNTERSKTPPSYGLPFMPLGEMYVEPHGKIEGSQDKPAPILSLIRQALRQPQPKVIFVKADFGSGKSLTARTLAYQLATELLTAQQGTSLEQDLPVFVRCADDFPSEGAFELTPTVRRAWKSQASKMGLELKTSDTALELPASEQRTTYILDGLDEIALGDRRLDSLMQRLQEETTLPHRFIVFSRPGALPPEHKLKDAIVISLLPFTTQDESQAPGGQVREWLTKWNTLLKPVPLLQPQDLAKQDLLEIAKTPILLFMIAQSWGELSKKGPSKTLAEIYEGFFRHIARGKHELDRESNTNVFEASNYLLEHLKNLDELGEDATAPDAMLWLMSRVAWEATKLEQGRPPEALTTRDVDRLIEEELELRPSSELTATIRMGLLLAMQADLRAGADHILFGHKSFREFLVARFWADRLRKLSSTPPREAITLESSLYGGRLLSSFSSEHFDFLIQLLDQLKPSERSNIVAWTQSCFENEEQVFKVHRGRPRGVISDDLRAPLREAALAVGCTIKGGHIEVVGQSSLLSLIAWFVAREEYIRIIMPGAVLQNTSLRNVRLFYADFGGATFEQVDLSDSSFGECYFSGAAFIGVELEIADLSDSLFDNATFTSGKIASKFSHCSFRKALFRNCEIEAGVFSKCSFKSARMEKVVIQDVFFQGCKLADARLLNCTLRNVNFGKCNLSKVAFQDTRYTEDVCWPEGFDPANTPGLRRID